MVTVVEEQTTAAEMPRVGHLTGAREWANIPDFAPDEPKDKARILHYMRPKERGGEGHNGREAMSRFRLIGPTVGIVRKLLQDEAESGKILLPIPEPTVAQQPTRTKRRYVRHTPVTRRKVAAPQGHALYVTQTSAIENGRPMWEVQYTCVERIDAPSVRGVLRELEARGSAVSEVFSIRRAEPEPARRGRPPKHR
jgi:hypothetical protein